MIAIVVIFITVNYVVHSVTNNLGSHNTGKVFPDIYTMQIVTAFLCILEH